MVDNIRQTLLKKLRELEKFPEFNEKSTLKELRGSRYPFERTLDEYHRVLPDLHDVLEKLPSQSKVIDLGMGKGIALREIKKSYNLHITGTGIQTVEMAPLPFVQTLAVPLSFKSNSLDLVISVGAISWEPDQTGAIDEIVRVLKPTGTALVSLIPFSQSVALWFGKKFWDEANVKYSEYRSVEFYYSKYTSVDYIDIYPMPFMYVPANNLYSYYLVIRKKKCSKTDQDLTL